MERPSMTGFGRGEAESDGRTWVAEVRSVNHRYLDSKIKLPNGYSVLEEKIKKKVQQYHERGRIDLFFSVNGDFSDLIRVDLNESLAREYRDRLTQLAEELDIGSEIDLTLLAALPDVIVRERENEDPDVAWPVIEQALDDALSSCRVMREKEGQALTRDLTERLTFFSETVDEIESMIPELVARRQTAIKERLERLLDDPKQLDPLRLAQEVAVLADKSDVTEELVRLKSHINQFHSFLLESGGIGRKLDFLIQEFLREVNTIGAKINDAKVAYLTVSLKSELEKMREQVQNIE